MMSKVSIFTEIDLMTLSSSRTTGFSSSTHPLLSSLAKFVVIAFVLASLGSVRSFAAEESCASCDRKVSFSGDFVHRRALDRLTFNGAPPGTEESYREGIFGGSFTASISGLPDGKYTLIVCLVEAATDSTNLGERVFDISVGDQALAKDLDLISAAGGPNKVYFVTGTVDHRDDTIGGPIVVSFRGKNGAAKLNTLEVKNPATGASMVFVRAADLVDPGSRRRPGRVG